MIGERKDPRKEFGAAVSAIAQEQERIVVLSADSGGSSGFQGFACDHPDRYYEFGIMEQGVVGIASGMAAAGKIPVFCAIAPFVTARPFEMLRNDLGYMRQNVKIVGRNGGLTYSDLGATHHSLEDYAITRMIPGMVVLAPQDPSEIRGAVRAMLEYEGPVYMRIGNGAQEELFEDKPFEIGKGSVIRQGEDVTILTTGYITPNVLEAATLLEEQGIHAQVIGMPTVWPLDEELILSEGGRTGKIVTVEEHYIYGGLGSAVAELCSAKGGIPVKRIGVPHTYAATGPYEQLLKEYGLDGAGIARQVKEFLE